MSDGWHGKYASITGNDVWCLRARTWVVPACQSVRACTRLSDQPWLNRASNSSETIRFCAKRALLSDANHESCARTAHLSFPLLTAWTWSTELTGFMVVFVSFCTQIKCVCETRDWDHAYQLRDALQAAYPNRVMWKVSPHLELEAKERSRSGSLAQA